MSGAARSSGVMTRTLMKLPLLLRTCLLFVVIVAACPSMAAPPIRVALYDDAGATGQGVPKVVALLGRSGLDTAH